MVKLKYKTYMLISERCQFFSLKEVMLTLLNKISPELALSNVPKMVKSVVLPAPEDPTIETTSDCWM